MYKCIIFQYLFLFKTVTRCRQTDPIWRPTDMEYSYEKVRSNVMKFLKRYLVKLMSVQKKKIIIQSINYFSRLLFNVLSLVSSPLHALYKTALDTMKPKIKSNLPPLEHHENVAVWMHLIRPGIFHSPNPDAMCAESHIVLLAKLAASQPFPAWSLIVQLLLVSLLIILQNIVLSNLILFYSFRIAVNLSFSITISF